MWLFCLCVFVFGVLMFVVVLVLVWWVYGLCGFVVELVWCSWCMEIEVEWLWLELGLDWCDELFEGVFDVCCCLVVDFSGCCVGLIEYCCYSVLVWCW